MENKLALTIGESLEWSKSKFEVFKILPFCLIKVPVFSKFAFSQLETFFTQNFFPRCHLQKCWGC
jgi:hypothetical protein